MHSWPKWPPAYQAEGPGPAALQLSRTFSAGKALRASVCLPIRKQAWEREGDITEEALCSSEEEEAFRFPLKFLSDVSPPPNSKPKIQWGKSVAVEIITVWDLSLKVVSLQQVDNGCNRGLCSLVPPTVPLVTSTFGFLSDAPSLQILN